MSKSKKFLGIIIWMVFIFFIVLIAFYLILISNGYKITYAKGNWKKIKIIKTGLIYLKSNPRDVDVYINNQLKSQKTPFTLDGISPGRYEVKITQKNYQDWSKTFVVEPSLVSSDDNIILFLSEPKNLEVTEPEQENFDTLLSSWPAKGLEIKKHSEIWFNDIIVTRFLHPVRTVNWYQDRKHILFQVDKGIRIIDPDGSNNIKLLDLQSESPSRFLPYDDGMSLLYKDGMDVKKAKIR